MLKKVKTLPFTGTKEQEQQLRVYMEQESTDLLPVMQEAQRIYGYLPIEVQKIIADGLKIPLEDVYSASTFYPDFRHAPRGKYEIAVCTGTACHMNGGTAIYQKIQELLNISEGECTDDRLFSLETKNCFGNCAVGPVLTVNEDMYTRVPLEEVETIIDKYREKKEEGGTQNEG
ncbi:MAG: NAD(P)H-dependent oxidoreductase subunit E [Lachnospiraceae bacterium]|nr:NAD(P)H-dependent oxidoreductase subunit E [Lachnospiraceae bacterium]